MRAARNSCARNISHWIGLDRQVWQVLSIKSWIYESASLTKVSLQALQRGEGPLSCGSDGQGQGHEYLCCVREGGRGPLIGDCDKIQLKLMTFGLVKQLGMTQQHNNWNNQYSPMHEKSRANSGAAARPPPLDPPLKMGASRLQTAGKLFLLCSWSWSWQGL